MGNAAIIESAAARAEGFAAAKGAPEGMAPMANLIRYAKGPIGLNWIADNCEAQAQHQERENHAAQFRVIAKRLRRATGGAA